MQNENKICYVNPLFLQDLNNRNTIEINTIECKESNGMDVQEVSTIFTNNVQQSDFENTKDCSDFADKVTISDEAREEERSVREKLLSSKIHPKVTFVHSFDMREIELHKEIDDAENLLKRKRNEAQITESYKRVANETNRVVNSDDRIVTVTFNFANDDALCSLNNKIHKLSRNKKNVDICLNLLAEAKKNKLKLNSSTYNPIIKLFVKQNNLDRVREMLDDMQLNGVDPDKYTYTLVISLLSKLNEVDAMSEICKLMKISNIQADNNIYNILIPAYLNHQEYEKAWDVFIEAKDQGAKLLPLTYESLLERFLKDEDGIRCFAVFNQMRNFHINIKLEMYDYLMELFLSNRNLGQAFLLCKNMRDQGLTLNVDSDILIDLLLDKI